MHCVPLGFNGQLIRLHVLKDWSAKTTAVFLSQLWQKHPLFCLWARFASLFLCGRTECAIIQELNPWKLSCLRCTLLFHLWFWEDNGSAFFLLSVISILHWKRTSSSGIEHRIQKIVLNVKNILRNFLGDLTLTVTLSAMLNSRVYLLFFYPAQYCTFFTFIPCFHEFIWDAH